MRFPRRPTPVAEPGPGAGEDLALRFPRTMLASARRILVLTGAGVYGEGGKNIPAFRHADALPVQLDDLWRF